MAAKPTDGGRRAVPVLGRQANRLLQPCNSVEQILNDPHPRPLQAWGETGSGLHGRLRADHFSRIAGQFASARVMNPGMSASQRLCTEPSKFT